MDSFTTIYDNYRYIIPLAIKKCRIYHNIEHYEQVALEHLWHASTNFQGKEDEFGAYAFVFVKNALLNELKKMARFEGRHVMVDDTTFTILEKPPLAIPEIPEHLESLFEKISPKDQQLLLFLYGYQYSYEETASLFNISIHSVKKRRDRAIKKIRQYLDHA